MDPIYTLEQFLKSACTTTNKKNESQIKTSPETLEVCVAQYIKEIECKLLELKTAMELFQKANECEKAECKPDKELLYHLKCYIDRQTNNRITQILAEIGLQSQNDDHPQISIGGK